jgi:hypothetical protein
MGTIFSLSVKLSSPNQPTRFYTVGKSQRLGLGSALGGCSGLYWGVQKMGSVRACSGRINVSIDQGAHVLFLLRGKPGASQGGKGFTDQCGAVCDRGRGLGGHATLFSILISQDFRSKD